MPGRWQALFPTGLAVDGPDGLILRGGVLVLILGFCCSPNSRFWGELVHCTSAASRAEGLARLGDVAADLGGQPVELLTRREMGLVLLGIRG